VGETAAPDIQVALGRAVRSLRTSRGYSQERLAELAGIHPRYVSDIERGRRNVAIVNLERLAHALEVTLSELMAEVEASR
jgi:transcriptional regulator with XRE-family HTH domain